MRSSTEVGGNRRRAPDSAIPIEGAVKVTSRGLIPWRRGNEVAGDSGRA